MSSEKRKHKPSDWDLESPLDEAVTLEQLINEPPFKEASDEGGNSTTAGARIPMWLHRRIVKIREMRGSPYEINSDVIRDAIYIGMRVLHLRYQMGPDWLVETRLAAAVDSTGVSRRIRMQVEELLAGIEETLRDDDYEKAAENLTNYIGAASDIQNDWHRHKIFRSLLDNKVAREVLDHCSPHIRAYVENEGKRPRKK